MNEGQKMRAQVIAKAMKDAAFRTELVKNPAAAIEKETGVKVGAGMSIKVVEDSASVVHLVLPGAPKAGELNDKQLEAVAGGGGMPYTGLFTCRNTAPLDGC